MTEFLRVFGPWGLVLLAMAWLLKVPVEPATVQRVQKWSVTGLIGYDVRELRPVYGAMVSRNAGPFVVQGGFIGTTVFVGTGVRW